MNKAVVLLGAVLAAALFSCSRSDEISLEEAQGLAQEGLEEILAKTLTKPWKGEEPVPGKRGGSWHSSMTNDPKSFNLQVAERDAETASLVNSMCDWLIEYDPVKRDWKARCASFEIETDEAKDTLKVIYTLRDDLYWSYYNSSRKEPVLSDDVIFWYNEINGDPDFHGSAYNGQFILLEDGSEAHIDIERISDKAFAFVFPRIVADPLLSTNMTFGPRHIYEKAKREGGVQQVLSLFTVADDPKTIPSMGEWFLTEYTAGQRIVFKRNPDYWKKDSAGVSIPYMDENIVRILPDENTQKLLFLQGELDSYSLRPEDLDEIVTNAKGGYTVFNAEGSLGAQLWSFNQNPQNQDSAFYEWFTKKEFRQAMSCILNRSRLNAQVFRGLAEPKYDFFTSQNPYYNPDISLEYRYDLKRAEQLLASIGMKRDLFGGKMRDDKKRLVEFDLSIPSDVTITSDTASIIMDEAAKIGIKINIRATDFQKLVEQLSETYDWQSLIIGLGTYNFPIQGSNVWPSDGNLHLWYPLQESPATDWEARIDYLYNEGSYTIDKVKAKAIWDEYQSIILEQCPVIFLMRRRPFFGLRDRWDLTNVYYDNLSGLTSEFIYLK